MKNDVLVGNRFSHTIRVGYVPLNNFDFTQKLGWKILKISISAAGAVVNQRPYIGPRSDQLFCKTAPNKTPCSGHQDTFIFEIHSFLPPFLELKLCTESICQVVL